MLSRKSQSLSNIVDTLRIYYDNIDEPEDTTQVPSQKDILAGLIASLDPPSAIQ